MRAAPASPQYDVAAWVAVVISLLALAVSVRQLLHDRAKEKSDQASRVTFSGPGHLQLVFPKLSKAEGETAHSRPNEWRAMARIDNRSDAAIHDVVVRAYGDGILDSWLELYRVNAPDQIEKTFQVNLANREADEALPVCLELYFTDANGHRWRRMSNQPPTQVDVREPTRAPMDVI